MSATTIHQTVFTAMKSKIASLEQRVRELEEENMALHLFKALGCDNDNLDELEYDDDNVSVVSDTVDTMVHILEMTHDEQEENETQCLQEWKDKFILINREFEDKLWKDVNKRVMEICYKKIFCRFVKKVVQCRREKKQQELALLFALDNAIEIPRRASLEAWKSVGYAEDAVNSLLEDLGKETLDEEIDEVNADESEEEGEEETTYDIAQRITLKINELKKSSKTTSPL